MIRSVERCMRGVAVLLVLLASLFLAGPAPAAPEASPPRPYFVSIKVDKAFMREGPSDNHRVKWIYQRKGLPLEVLASFEVWRRVKDMDGEIGWIHTALLSRDRTTIVKGNADVPVRRRAEASSDVVADAKPGAIGQLLGCTKSACEVKFEAARGWIERTRLWGIHDGDEY